MRRGRSSAGFAGAIRLLGGGSEGAVEAPSDDLAARRRVQPPAKIDSGKEAETIQFGASTISLIERSTATLERI